MADSTPVPVVLVGAGSRAAGFYVPLLLDALADQFELVGLIGRSEHRLRPLAERCGLRWSLSLDQARGWGAAGAVVAVSPDQNHGVGRQLAELGLPALLETPLALEIGDARELLTLLDATGLPYEIAEQNTRHLPALLWCKLVADGHIGTLRAVLSDGSPYRYHATAVARRLFGERSAKTATGLRVLSDIDLGRGVDREPLYAGAISVENDGLFQMRASEAFYFEQPGWMPGEWTLLGDEGAIHSDRGLRSGKKPQGEALGFVWHKDSAGVPTGLSVDGLKGAEVLVSLPGAGLDNDQQAVARCLLDWHARMRGELTTTSWSPRDAYADLQWIVAIERSAQLGGAPLHVESI